MRRDPSCGRAPRGASWRCLSARLEAGCDPLKRAIVAAPFCRARGGLQTKRAMRPRLPPRREAGSIPKMRASRRRLPPRRTAGSILARSRACKQDDCRALAAGRKADGRGTVAPAARPSSGRAARAATPNSTSPPWPWRTPWEGRPRPPPPSAQTTALPTRPSDGAALAFPIVDLGLEGGGRMRSSQAAPSSH